MVALRTMATSAIKIGACVSILMLGLAGVAHARSISGRVTDEDTGGPIVGATVTASSSDASYSDWASTDDGGYYTVHGLPGAADFIVSASAQEYLTEYYCEATSVQDAVLLDLSVYDAAGIDFTLSPVPPPEPRTISGRVVLEGTTTGIPEVRVVAYDPAAYVFEYGGGYLGGAETDGQGNYTISGPDSTCNFVAVWTESSDYLNEVYDDVRFTGMSPPIDFDWWLDPVVWENLVVLDLMAGSADGIDFALGVARSVSGRVIEQGTATGVPGATVTAVSSLRSYGNSATADGEGYYTIECLTSAPDWIVQASHSGYETEWYHEAGSEEEATFVDLTSGDAAGIDFTLSTAPGPEPRTISGRVVLEGTTTGISGVPVVAYDLAGYVFGYGGGYLGEAETDGQGSYTISGLDSSWEFVGVWTQSSYYVNEVYDDVAFTGVNPPTDFDWWIDPLRLDNVVPVDLTDSSADGADFALSVPRSVSGRVIEEGTRAGIADVTVTAFSSAKGYWNSATTDSSGYYIIEYLVSGTDWIVESSKPGYETEWYYEAASAEDATPIDLTVDDVTGIDFSLSVSPGPAPRTISGRVVFEDTATGISGVAVVAYDLASYVFGYGAGYLGQGETDVDGNYTIPGLDSSLEFVGVWTQSSYYVNEIYDDVAFTGVNPPTDFDWWTDPFRYYNVVPVDLREASADGIDFALSGGVLVLPKVGSRVSGAEVTVAARLDGGFVPNVESIRFQYQPAADSVWTDIVPPTGNTPNPDLTQPYFVYWDTAVLSPGDYDLRAVIIEIDDSVIADQPITVTVDHSAPEITEYRNGEGHHEVVAVALAAEEVRAGGADAATAVVADVILPPGALDTDTALRMVFPDPATVNPYVEGVFGLSTADVFVQLTLDSGQTEFIDSLEAILNMEYPDADQDGIVDGTQTDEKALRVLYYDEVAQAWAALSYTGIDDYGNVLHAKTTHFTIFGGLGVDSDGDGLPDNLEDLNGNSMVDPGETDPFNPDSDGDTIPDGDEVEYGFDPTTDDGGDDSDRDGISNADEYAYGTDPTVGDTDGDGLSDGAEMRDLDPDTPGIQNPFDPLNRDATGDNLQDTSDGRRDGWNDWDGDGMCNAYEFAFGTNPLDAGSFSEVPGTSMVTIAALAIVVLAAIGRRVRCERE